MPLTIGGMSNVSPREGYRPIQFWAEQVSKDRFDEWLKVLRWDLSEALRLAMDGFAGTQPAAMKAIERLAIIHGVTPGAMLARCIEEGLKVEEARITITPTDKPGKRR